MERCPVVATSARGFTLMELLIAMSLTLVITGAALTAFLNARTANDTAAQLLEMNDGLRAAADLVVRDLIQAGQGLPAGKVIDKPNGGGAIAIERPGPPESGLTFPVTETVFPAVMTGAGLGPDYQAPDGGAGPATDVITLLYVDSQFDGLACTITPNGRTIPVFPNASQGGARITGPNVSDPIAAGDLVLITGSEAASGSALLYVTQVQGQSVHADEDDPMGLNQHDASDGTIMQLLPSPASATRAVLSRVRMLTYYIDNATDPPRLMRQLNYNTPRVVAFGIDNLQVSYDLADGVNNPTNVESPESPSQIRKVNLHLSARSRRPLASTRQFLRNSISTQVALRSLAFVDRYR